MVKIGSEWCPLAQPDMYESKKSKNSRRRTSDVKISDPNAGEEKSGDRMEEMGGIQHLLFRPNGAGDMVGMTLVQTGPQPLRGFKTYSPERSGRRSPQMSHSSRLELSLSHWGVVVVGHGLDE